MYGPVLRGEKVTLRPPTDDEAKLFVEWFADTDVTRYLGTRFPPALYQEEEFLKKIGESKEDVFWVIEAEGRAVGASGIH
ncbi:MAG TPA: GNAT family N-acetyltransferase, partial [Candidatus Limnocylindrales bacterium]|nr:GNAT family N-acetyltransferase [Candidatus Limnocylindrales bacterium]